MVGQNHEFKSLKLHTEGVYEAKHGADGSDP